MDSFLSNWFHNGKGGKERPRPKPFLEKGTTAKPAKSKPSSCSSARFSTPRSPWGTHVKALVVNALGRGFDLEEVDIAAPMGREVLVDVKASGLCHTDLLFATHGFVPLPAVLGHEVAGVVAAVGSDVAQICVGDHVVGSLAQSCGVCARCLSGRPFQCRHPESTLRRPIDSPRLTRNGVGLFQGYGLGGFAEQALIHENQLAPVPKELPFPQAALL